MAPTRHWLIKSEPSSYAYAALVRDGRTEWTGVRNFEARNNLRAMSPGDLCLYYHSVEEKAVVGIARVTRTARPDTTATDGDWVSVEVAPVEALPTPVTLERIKQDRALRDFALLTRSRLSVAPVTDAQFAHVAALGRAPAPLARVSAPTSRASRSGRGPAARAKGPAKAAKAAPSRKRGRRPPRGKA